VKADLMQMTTVEECAVRLERFLEEYKELQARNLADTLAAQALLI
jgi:hypothetical protein